MKCPNCGIEIKKDYKYCPNCRMLLTKKSQLKIHLKELLFILLIIGSIIPFLWLLIITIQNYNAGVQKEFLCLDACEPTILYGKEAIFHTLITISILLSPMFIGSIILIIVSIKELKHIKNSLKHFLIITLIIVMFIVAVFSISLIKSHKLNTNQISRTANFDTVTITYQNGQIVENKEVIKYYKEGQDDIYFFMNKGKYLIKIYNYNKEYFSPHIEIRGNNFQKINKFNQKEEKNFKIDEVKTENLIYKYEYVYDTDTESFASIKNISTANNSYYAYIVELEKDALLYNPINLSNAELALNDDFSGESNELYKIVYLTEKQEIEIKKIY